MSSRVLGCQAPFWFTAFVLSMLVFTYQSFFSSEAFFGRDHGCSTANSHTKISSFSQLDSRNCSCSSSSSSISSSSSSSSTNNSIGTSKVATSSSSHCNNSRLHPGFVFLPHLPLLSLRPAGTRWKSPSSADKSGGSTDRGFISYANGTQLIVADYFGPGMIFWMWATHDGANGGNYDIWAKKCTWTLEIDDRPYLQFTLDDLCGGSPKGNAFPFVPPYNEKIGQKQFMSDGCWFHLPVVFERRVRLFKERFEDEYPRTGPLGGDYISLQVSLFPPSACVSYWAKLPIDWYDAQKDMFAASWSLRTSALDDCSFKTIANESTAICHLPAQRFHQQSARTPQVVCQNCSGAVTSVICSKHQAKSTDRIRIHFDESQTAPQVDAVFRDFFAYYEDSSAAIRSMWHGQTSEQKLVFALPMPFWHSLIFFVDSDASCSLEFVTGDCYVEAETGHFHLKSTDEDAIPGKGSTIFRASSAGGHVVMTSIRLNQPMQFFQWYTQRALESDVMIHENGRRSASSYSSSFEDFFFFPNSFSRGVVGFPHIGCQLNHLFAEACCPSWCPGRPMELDSTCPSARTELFLHGYRLFAPDVIPFESSLVIALEHGSESIRNQVSFNTQAAAGWYGKPYSLIQSVLEFDSFDALQTMSHSYTVDPYFQEKNVTGTFMSVDGGLYDVTEFTFTAVFVPTQSSFGCSIDPNNGGVILRRTAVYLAGQRANVFVNAHFVGSWESMESNSFFAFNEFEFVIDKRFTEGHQYLQFSFKVLPPLPTRPSLRWDFVPDAYPMMSPQALHPSMCTWNEIKWEVLVLAPK
jgi:hypothetical protein